jgi:hypothetical protein
MNKVVLIDWLIYLTWNQDLGLGHEKVKFNNFTIKRLKRNMDRTQLFFVKLAQ